MTFDAKAFLEGLYDVPVTVEPDTEPGINVADLPADWRVEWEERAAIREYDGGQAREHAEAEALRETIERMTAAGANPRTNTDAEST